MDAYIKSSEISNFYSNINSIKQSNNQSLVENTNTADNANTTAIKEQISCDTVNGNKKIIGCKTDTKRQGKRVRALSSAEKKRIIAMLELWGETNNGLRAKREELEATRRARENAGFTVGMLAVAEHTFTIPAFEQHTNQLVSEINACMENKRQMDSIIDTLPIMTQAVLRARYIKHLRWDLVTVYLPFQISERHCFRLHNQALLHIRDSLRKNEYEI